MEPQDTLSSDILANRRGELTPEQRAMLGFWLEAQQLTASLGSIIALAGLILLGCLLSPVLDQLSWVWLAKAAILIALGVYLISNITRSYRRLSRFAAGLRKGKVAQADGLFGWDGRCYSVQAPHTEKLRVDFSLLPGAYRFYYVPCSGMVLTSERLGNQADARQCLQTALMDACRFDAAALATNRLGRMTESQKSRLLIQTVLFYWARMLGVLVLGTLVDLMLINFQMGRGVEYTWTAILGAAPFVIVMAVLLADYMQKLADLREGQVLTMQGLGVRDASTGEWQINCETFRVPRRTSAALVSGLRYRAYYLPRTRFLISIEPLTFKSEALTPRHSEFRLTIPPK